MDVVITHTIGGVSWTIYERVTRDIIAFSSGEHLTEKGAKKEAEMVMKIIKEEGGKQQQL